jgi:hypothetical protein
MAKRSILFLMSILVMMMACTTLNMSAMSGSVPRMTKDQLKSMLDNPDLVIIDVRAGADWLRSDIKIKGAVREDYNDVNSWANKYAKNKLIVLYCA